MEAFNKTRANFCCSLHCKGYNSYFFVNGKEIFKFKAGNRKSNFQLTNGLVSLSLEKYL